ncbi:hypothetical protein MHYP_G00154140 [Metynnis hypsauchen]
MMLLLRPGRINSFQFSCDSSLSSAVSRCAAWPLAAVTFGGSGVVRSPAGSELTLTGREAAPSVGRKLQHAGAKPVNQRSPV